MRPPPVIATKAFYEPSPSKVHTGSDHPLTTARDKLNRLFHNRCTNVLKTQLAGVVRLRYWIKGHKISI